MGKRKGTAIWIPAAALAAVVGLFYCVWPREPVYQGKRLTEWLEQIDDNRGSDSPKHELRLQAQAVVRRLETNEVPFYLKLMKTRESFVVVKFLTLAPKLAPKSWLNRFHVPKLNDYRSEIFGQQRLGALGVAALGEDAKPFVPALIGLMSDKGPNTKRFAVLALWYLGPTASEALPELIGCLKDLDGGIRANAADSLAVIHREPERVVPALIDSLQDALTQPILVRKSYAQSAIKALGRFGPEAKEAVPVLVKLLKDPKDFRVDVRAAATNALQQIAPEALATAEAGGQGNAEF
jgi:HEAT repeats